MHTPDQHPHPQSPAPATRPPTSPPSSKPSAQTTILIPTIELAPAPTPSAALDAALAAIRTYDWLIFTSANAVEAFHRRAQFHRIPAIPKRIAAIGPRHHPSHRGHRPASRPHPTATTSPSPSPKPSPPHARTASGQPAAMLLIRAEQARDILPENPQPPPAPTSPSPTPTRNQTPPESIPALRELFASPATYPHAITFTSSSTATNLFNLLEAANITLPS